MTKSRIFVIITISFLIMVNSCIPYKKLKYVQETGDYRDKNSYLNIRSPKTIQPYDKLYIKILSLDEKTNAVFNDRSTSSNNNIELLSYTVNYEGYINFPFIGQVYIKDLSINEAQEKLQGALNEYLRDISVNVRFVGNMITVLGEVNKAGGYAFYDDKVTIFEALGFAGGIAEYGDKSRITLIREDENNINYYYLDLTQKDIAESKLYYLLPNDIIIVNPIKSKFRYFRDYTLTSTVLSTIQVLITVVTFIRLSN